MRAAAVSSPAVIASFFVASRLIVLAAALAAEYLVTGNLALTSGDDAPLRSLTSWGGWWYLGIARDGYHAVPLSGDYPDFAFFPLYPLLVLVLSVPWPGFAGLVAVLVSNIAFAVALALLYELGRPYLGRAR